MTIDFKYNAINSNLKDIFIRDDGKSLKIFFGGNGELYFDIFGDYTYDEKGARTSGFFIAKDSDIYYHFDNLFNDILNYQVYDEIDPEFFESNVDLNKELKDSDANSSLIKDGNIEWYSDAIYDERANLMIIKRTDEGIVFSFFDNPGDPAFGFGIRISNSGSKYEPFNLCFMKLFNTLQKVVTPNEKKLERKPE